MSVPPQIAKMRNNYPDNFDVLARTFSERFDKLADCSENVNPSPPSAPEALLAPIAQKAKQNAKIENGDYIRDGLLYCGKCNTPKQKRLEAIPELGIVNCLCSCGVQKQQEEEHRREAERRQQQIDALLERLSAYNLIEPPDRMVAERDESGEIKTKRSHAISFTLDDEQCRNASKKAREYVENFEAYKADGEGIVFYGVPGTGKSFLASCIVSDLLDRGYAAAVTSFPRIESALWERNDRQSALDLLTRLDLIAIDDLFAERDTSYMTEKVFAVVDAMIRAKVPMIVTTNLNAEQLADKSDIGKMRILSRLYGSCSFVKVDGRDRRAIKSLQRKNAERM